MLRTASIFLVSVLLTALPSYAGEDKVSPAVDAAKVWLEITDAGQYAESWDTAASLFRNSISKPDWIAALERSRKPLGGVRSRTVTSAMYLTSIAGAPPGEYVVITFTTDFDNKPGATESVTPQLASNGLWKVSGYFIK